MQEMKFIKILPEMRPTIQGPVCAQSMCVHRASPDDTLYSFSGFLFHKTSTNFLTSGFVLCFPFFFLY